MSTTIKDFVELKGRVRIFGQDEGEDKPKLLWDDPNLIVRVGRQYLAKLISDPAFN